MLYIYVRYKDNICSIWEKMSYNTWGLSKVMVSITWGANWDSCGTANCIIIILNPSPYYILEVSIVTV